MVQLKIHNHRDWRKILNRSLQTSHHLNKNATNRAQYKLGDTMQGVLTMAPCIGVSTILLGSNVSLWSILNWVLQSLIE